MTFHSKTFIWIIIENSHSNKAFPLFTETEFCSAIHKWYLLLVDRGAKATYWQGGVRGDSFIWSPLLKKRGRIFDGLVHVTDWLPTILHAATGSPPKVWYLLNVLFVCHQYSELVIATTVFMYLSSIILLYCQLYKSKTPSEKRTDSYLLKQRQHASFWW